MEDEDAAQDTAGMPAVSPVVSRSIGNSHTGPTEVANQDFRESCRHLARGSPRRGSFGIRLITSHRSSWSLEVHLRMRNSKSLPIPFCLPQRRQFAQPLTIGAWMCPALVSRSMFPCLQGQSPLDLDRLLMQGRCSYTFVKFPSGELALDTGWCAAARCSHTQRRNLRANAGMTGRI